MLVHAVVVVIRCISVHAVLVLLQAARLALPYINNEEDSDSPIVIESNSRHYEYTVGQLMNFSCVLKEGLVEQYANLSLSIEGVVNKSESFGKRMVSLSKVAEESDNNKKLHCYLRYEGVREPYIFNEIINILYPPRADDDLRNGTYQAIGDFRVGEGANVTVRIRANPTPHLVIWKMNGRHLDSDRFQPWTSDQILFQDGTGVAVLYIMQVQLRDFTSVFQLEVINNQGSTTIPVKMHLQEIDVEPPGWSIGEVFFLVIFVAAIIIVGLICFFTLKSRKRFEEKNTNDDELRQVNCSAPQEEINLQNVITHEPMTNIKDQNSQRNAGGMVPIADEPLINAVPAGKEEEVRKLLEGGADVEIKINNGSNSLHILAKNRTNDEQPANFSAQQEEANPLNVRIDMTNINQRNPQTIAGNENPGKVVTGAELINAVWTGNEEEVRKLLEGGADVETKTENGLNSLHIAAQKGFLEILQLLCEKVEDIDAINEKKKTALMFATGNGHLEVVKYLLSLRADNVILIVNVNLLDDEGNTLLHMAVSSGNLKLVEIFVESYYRVTDINANNNKDKTALKAATDMICKNTNIIKYLQKHGAKPP